MSTETITIASVMPLCSSANGGVNTLNTEFCVVLAERLGERCRLVCIKTDTAAVDTRMDEHDGHITLSSMSLCDPADSREVCQSV